MNTGMHLMMKCDLCYDRTSVGKKPMCASVCPSQALFFGTREEVEKLRPSSKILNSFQFGSQIITTKVNMLVPKSAMVEHLDVVEAIHQSPPGNKMAEDILTDAMFETEASDES